MHIYPGGPFSIVVVTVVMARELLYGRIMITSLQDLRDLFENHCECRPLDFERRSHDPGSTCSTEILADIQILLRGNDGTEQSKRECYAAVKRCDRVKQADDAALEAASKMTGASYCYLASSAFQPCVWSVAAKHLHLTAARFLAGRASSRELDEAIKIWHDATREHEEARVSDSNTNLPGASYRPHESVSATLTLSRANRSVSDPLDIDVVITIDVGAGLEHLRPVVHHEGVLALPGDGALTLPAVTGPTQLEFDSALRAALAASGWQVL